MWETAYWIFGIAFAVVGGYLASRFYVGTREKLGWPKFTLLLVAIALSLGLLVYTLTPS